MQPQPKHRHTISASTQFWKLLERRLHPHRGVLRLHGMGLQAPRHLPKKTTIRSCHARQPFSSATPFSGTKQHSSDLLCSYSKDYHSPPCLRHLISRREGNHSTKSHSTLRTLTLIPSFTSAAYLPHVADASTRSLKPPIAPLQEKLEFYSI